MDFENLEGLNDEDIEYLYDATNIHSVEQIAANACYVYCRYANAFLFTEYYVCTGSYKNCRTEYYGQTTINVTPGQSYIFAYAHTYCSTDWYRFCSGRGGGADGGVGAVWCGGDISTKYACWSQIACCR